MFNGSRKLFASFYFYRVFGLTLRSNYVLPCLHVDASTTVDWTVDFAGVQSIPAVPEHLQTAVGKMETEWQGEDGQWHLRYVDQLDGSELAVTICGRRRLVHLCWSKRVVVADICRVLLGTIFGRLLHAVGILTLHANAIQIDDACILLCAVSGGGKSSAAAALVNAGFPLLSDDVAALNLSGEGVQVAHGYPQLRLWPDSADSLGAAWQALPTVFRRTETMGDKCYRDLQPHPQLYSAHDLPLRAIYFLGPRVCDVTAISAIVGHAGFALLLQNLYLGQLAAPSLLAPLFPQVAMLVERSDLFHLSLPSGLERLPEFAAALAAHVRSL